MATRGRETCRFVVSHLNLGPEECVALLRPRLAVEHHDPPAHGPAVAQRRPPGGGGESTMGSFINMTLTFQRPYA